jgi:long-chain fatty acid transport protein
VKRLLLAIALFPCVPLTARANNGLNMIGFGTESVAMGGADVAWSRDTSALNTNPAALSNLNAPALDLFAAAAYAIDVAHADQLGNDQGVDNRVIPLAGFGYAQPIHNSSLVAGVGLFAQGGAGYVYRNIVTPFGGRDELSSLFRIAKLSVGGAWTPDDRVSVGAALSLVYGDIKQQVFPETSVPGFFGYSLDGPHALRPGLKIGLLYRPREDVTLGATYTAATKLPLDGGHLTANLSALDLGDVTYQNVKLDGLSLPQEVALGFAWQPNPPWVISLKLDWLDWSNAVSHSQLAASEPDHPAAPPVLSADSTLGWRDQYVIAMGLIHRLGPKDELLAGYNYGRNPSPPDHTQPLLAAISEHHLTAGLRHHSDGNWQETYAVEYQPGAKVVYSNPESPFGPNAEERNRYVALHAMFSRRW